MKKIGSKFSSQELYVIGLIKSLGYKFELHSKNLPGAPDLAFPDCRKVILNNSTVSHKEMC
ncbi:MAG: hypothetical protein KAJ18_11280 [Candidatus Omnitrophica bacterium]|nr:hypothetical protein [Candidatus Omnitrophota bacterium]